MDRKKLSVEEEEAFRKFIVVDEDDAAKVRPVRQPNTKPHQMNRIIKFAEELAGKNLTKEECSSCWDTLATELNKTGPPAHTALEWRRIWTAHKSNEKYKAKRVKSDSIEVVSEENISVFNDEQSQPVDMGQRSNAARCDDNRGSNNAEEFDDQTTAAGSDICSIILEKTNVLIDKQNELINLVSDLIQWLKINLCTDAINRNDNR
ncbi:uncharacterized protein LOC119067035 [Bradysia coprophila]|uniref:uncharacterized protein LOC119067035 n=1 Tax=Bradysia coprophila TaxID=38358 RepID=UPI00187D774F|nr:uncharacterized protein LOC119067035 [Bradysia coprophila]